MQLCTIMNHKDIAQKQAIEQMSLKKLRCIQATERDRVKNLDMVSQEPIFMVRVDVERFDL